MRIAEYFSAKKSCLLAKVLTERALCVCHRLFAAAAGAAPAAAAVAAAAGAEPAAAAVADRAAVAVARVAAADEAGGAAKFGPRGGRGRLKEEMTIVNVNKLFQERSLFFVADCCVRARSSAAAAAGVLGGVLFDFFIAVRIARRCATTRVSAAPQTHSARRRRVSRISCVHSPQRGNAARRYQRAHAGARRACGVQAEAAARTRRARAARGLVAARHVAAGGRVRQPHR